MVQGTEFSPGGGLSPQEVFQRRDSQTALIQSVQAGGAGVDTDFEPAEPVEPVDPDTERMENDPEPRQTEEAADVGTAAIERRAPDVDIQQTVNELVGAFLEENISINNAQDPLGATSGFGAGGGKGGNIDLVA